MLVRPPEADKPLAGWILDSGCWILDAGCKVFGDTLSI
ncbi:hypothetical protein D3OALGB2SA_2326 [Olavius algarvensis associated proteobacterium Delta 3]|nr:hypothetical protein D3OALGB2SA_2326 [Olavius algarvensis associated proteobacterium Delta 3]